MRGATGDGRQLCVWSIRVRAAAISTQTVADDDMTGRHAAAMHAAR